MLVYPQLQASTVISIFQIKRGYFSLPYTHACLNFSCIILPFLKDAWLKKEVYFFHGNITLQEKEETQVIFILESELLTYFNKFLII